MTDPMTDPTTDPDDRPGRAHTRRTEPAEDTQGHRRFSSATESGRDEPAPAPASSDEDEDDAEGHRIYARSDRTIKTAIVAVTWDLPAR